MSAPVDSERKGHKRKLADTFTYSNAVAGTNGGEKETITVQVRAFECQQYLIAVFFHSYLRCLVLTTGQTLA